MENTTPVISIDLILDRLSTKDALKALLHSILFHRLFGTIKPQTIEVLDVTMPGVKDMQTEMLIDEKVDAFWKGVESGANKSGRITVTFSEKRQKKNWFSVGEEEVPWEKWVINAEVRNPKAERDRQTFNTTLSTSLSDALFTILTYTASERGRTAVPPITNSSGITPFPFKISVWVAGNEVR
ncbi:DUF1649-domain-containing protein [Fomitiporia mediterranea MF3/22]|uniref:DUF1649-domain-containing protein n=1 Tax=Fomitiporia mediterranea (strain MF3/22) TaxID=694068 RepID=UPI0004409BDB|nr:DUF1649-domain-containing protein [Fomitiporia mediterranea MF3/22]EJC98550.1 DUF1649-domain-containing protein [Fomitiporia mediterranea MF3/22]